MFDFDIQVMDGEARMRDLDVADALDFERPRKIRDLFARMLIRFSLGKSALRNSSVNPVARGAMRAAGRVKARHDKADRHDGSACA